MGAGYCNSSSCVVAWDTIVLEMIGKKVLPQNELNWGKPQVVRLKWKCTGTATACKKHDCSTEYRVKEKYGGWHDVQCGSTVIITVKKAEEQAKAELEVESGYSDLFGVDNGQSQWSNNDPQSPPPRCRKRRSEEGHEVGNDDR